MVHPEALKPREAWSELLLGKLLLHPRGCRGLVPGGGVGQGRGARQLLRKWQAGEQGSPVIIKEQRYRGTGSLHRPLGQAG